MAPVGGEQVAREEIERPPALPAIEELHPDEGLHRDIGVAVERTGGPVERTDVGAQRGEQIGRGAPVGVEINPFDLFPDDPGRHRVDVEPFHIAADAVRLDERGSPAHERIPDPAARQVVGAEEIVLQPPRPELGEQQPPKEGPRTAGEPLVDADDRAVVLLELLFPARQPRDQGNIEPLFDAHCRSSSDSFSPDRSSSNRASPKKGSFSRVPSACPASISPSAGPSL